jgi:undecaprenyl diphosphate synthase
MGHREGVKAAERAIQSAKNAGVKVLTLYTFSTENWKRPKEEVDALMSLLGAYLDKETARLSREGIKLNVIGDIATLPDSVSARIKKSMDATAHNDILTLNWHKLRFKAGDPERGKVYRAKGSGGGHRP